MFDFFQYFVDGYVRFNFILIKEVIFTGTENRDWDNSAKLRSPNNRKVGQNSYENERDSSKKEKKIQNKICPAEISPPLNII